jgi:hypothetical protein
VIFLYLRRRRITRLFGPYVSQDDLHSLCEVSEWEAVKYFIRPSWRFFDSAEKKEARLREIAKAAREALARTPEERQARLKKLQARRSVRRQRGAEP